jgi:predicted hydrocarbon binding protein
MSFLDRHPRFAKVFLRPIANAPVLSRRLPVLARAYMGATAFEIHDVDVDKGRIGIGGVDEIMWSSKFLELFHQVLASKMGAREKNDALYEVGRAGGYYEISEAIARGRWAPASLVELVEQGGTLERLRTDPTMARFFELSMGMALRLIINEGGWGVSRMDLHSSPLTVTLANSQEARWVGPADEPTCYISAGVIAGYSSRILGQDLNAKEVRCMSMGHPECVFELEE